MPDMFKEKSKKLQLCYRDSCRSIRVIAQDLCFIQTTSITLHTNHLLELLQQEDYDLYMKYFLLVLLSVKLSVDGGILNLQLWNRNDDVMADRLINVLLYEMYLIQRV